MMDQSTDSCSVHEMAMASALPKPQQPIPPACALLSLLLVSVSPFYQSIRLAPGIYSPDGGRRD